MDFAITEPDWNGAQSIGDVLETEGERGGRQDEYMLYAVDDDPNGTPQSGDDEDDDDDDESQLDKIVVSESELHRDDGDKKNKERNNDDEVKVGGVMRKDDVDDESVARVCDERKSHGWRWIENKKWDKRGRIIQPHRTCGLAGCEYKTGNSGHMRSHQAVKHGINVDWFSCGEKNCN
ncbi:hypothetical protein TrLO_g2741 [Triparma laevis f. longispina]|uniref:Uncharacterized protein n=1 Tax=Triparma laevis f. longispina TaxID=1714387 RepID=A0A9W7CCL1_9STRA|nr:hypothetical protein TrLO_g2741 [Triparma laevis f. longispina]